MLNAQRAAVIIGQIWTFGCRVGTAQGIDMMRASISAKIAAAGICKDRHAYGVVGHGVGGFANRYVNMLRVAASLSNLSEMPKRDGNDARRSQH